MIQRRPGCAAVEALGLREIGGQSREGVTPGETIGAEVRRIVEAGAVLRGSTETSKRATDVPRETRTMSARHAQCRRRTSRFAAICRRLAAGDPAVRVMLATVGSSVKVRATG